MTTSTFQTLAIVQLVPDGEWLVAIPAPDQSESDNPAQWAVDVYKDLSFAELKTTAELAAVQDAPPFNRLIPMQLALIPSLPEASPFTLLTNLIQVVLLDSPDQAQTTPKRIAALTLYGLLRTMGRRLQEALTSPPERVETLYAAHDFLAHSLESQLRAAGVSPETSLADDALPPEETT
jgi:hypothetical protein